MNTDGVLDGDGELERINEEMIQRKAVETYQCPGCVCGSDFKCFERDDSKSVGIGCTKHCAGTMMLGVGSMFLGMPIGFNRLGPRPENPEQKMKLVILRNYEDFEYDKFNIPVWKHKDEHGNTLVRGLSPRLNHSFLHVRLDDCFDKIDCLEITKEDIEEMN